MKEPPVFLDYDAAELDAAYDQAVWAANRQQILARYAALSAVVRSHLGEPVRYSYGPSKVETLDLYPARETPAPIHVFVHGGAWRAGAARDYAFPAEMFVAAGAHYIALDFIAVQDAGGSLMTMAEQVRRAIAWVYRNASRFGGDPDRLYLSGHSSGAHLAAVALTTRWTDLDLPENCIKAGLCISGMYDLKAVRLSARSAYVNFDDWTEESLSPERHIDALKAPLVVAYGALESPEFQRQARDFAAAVAAAGKPVDLVLGEHYNHFEMAETLANPYGLTGRAALAQMGIGPR
jgi:arylformamidase